MALLEQARDCRRGFPMTSALVDSWFRPRAVEAGKTCFSPRQWFQWAHDALEEAFTAVDDQMVRAFEEGGWAMPLVHVELDVLEAAQPDERIRRKLILTHLGQRSVNLTCEFYSQDGLVLARASMIHVVTSLDGLQSMATIPRRLLRVLGRS
jgi:acyl-CoA thioesterase FadM